MWLVASSSASSRRPALSEILANLQPGHTVRVGIERSGATKTLSVTRGALPG